MYSRMILTGSWIAAVDAKIGAKIFVRLEVFRENINSDRLGGTDDFSPLQRNGSDRSHPENRDPITRIDTEFADAHASAMAAGSVKAPNSKSTLSGRGNRFLAGALTNSEKAPSVRDPK